MFAVIIVGVLLTVLLSPSWIVLLFFDRLTPGQAVRKGWRVWAMQVIFSSIFAYLANVVGLLNPAGYTLGICAITGTIGAFFLWRSDHSNHLKSR